MDKTIPIEARAECKDGRYHAFARVTDERGTRCVRADASTYQESVHRAITLLMACDEPGTRVSADRPGLRIARLRSRRVVERAIQHQVAN